MEPTKRPQRGPRLHVPAALAALLLSGCPGPNESDILRSCFVLSPVCYLLGVGILWGLRAAVRKQHPDVLFRPWLLSLPAVGLTLLILLSALVAPSTYANLDLELTLLFSPLLIPLIGGGLWTPMLLLWRALFRDTPRTSFEHAALITCVLFFAPWLRIFYADPYERTEHLAGIIGTFTLLVGLGGISTAILVLFLLREARTSARK